MTSNRHQKIILDSKQVRAALPALANILESLDVQTSRVVRCLEEAQCGDPHQYLSGGIAEGFDAGRASRRAAAELRDVIDRVDQMLNAFDHHDRDVQLVQAALPAPTIVQVASTAPTSSQSVPSVSTDGELCKEDYVDKGDYGSEPPPDSEDLINKLLELEFPWWLDAALSFFVIGDILDIIKQQILNRLAGKEPDNLITAIAAFGLVMDAGWLQPFPSVEDAPNAIFALLKTIAKRLPKGKTRDYLAELIEKAAKNPDDLKRLIDVGVALSKHPDILEKLIANPEVMRIALEGGSEFVELLAKENAISAFALLKTIAKRLPQGETRDYLAELIEKAAKNPDDLKRLIDVGVALSKHPDIQKKLIANPKVMRVALEGGSEFVELLAKLESLAKLEMDKLKKDTKPPELPDAVKAANNLLEFKRFKNAPDVINFFKQYDEISDITGAGRLLKDLQVDAERTVIGAEGEIRYFHSIKDDLAEVACRETKKSEDGTITYTGRKAADAILKDGTVIDVKNWDFRKDFYQNPATLDRAIDTLLDQVDLRRDQYPGQPIKYVFTVPLDQVPAPVKEALTEAGVIVEGMPFSIEP